MDLANSLLPEIEHFRMLGYWILLLIALVESIAFIGMLVPGTLFMIMFGSLAAHGYFSVVGLIWFAMFGAFLGDAGSFHLGRKGTGIFRENNRFFKTAYLDRGKAFFHRHGARSIFLGRFIGPVRAFIPFIAGLSAMKPAKFYCWDALTIATWAISHLLLGYYLGQAWRQAEVWSARIGIVLAAAALVYACFYLMKRFLSGKA